MRKRAMKALAYMEELHEEAMKAVMFLNEP